MRSSRNGCNSFEKNWRANFVYVWAEEGEWGVEEKNRTVNQRINKLLIKKSYPKLQ